MRGVRPVTFRVWVGRPQRYNRASSGACGGHGEVQLVSGRAMRRPAGRRSPLFRKVDCLSLPVDNLDEALAFYQHTLGHELIWRDLVAAGLKFPGSEAELVLHLDDRPMEVDLMVDSVPDAVTRFCKAGGELVHGPFPIRIGLCAVVRDPWGNQLVILDSSKGTLQTDANGFVIGNRGSNP